MGVVVEQSGGGFRAHCKGASEIILAACENFIDSNGQVASLDEVSTNHLKTTIDQFASEALRTLCLAYKDLGSEVTADSPIPESGYTCIGIVAIKDPVRPDNINTAKAIARECGILTDDGIAIEGPDFQEKNHEELLKLIPKIQMMARSSPLDKDTLVKNLRTTFEEVVAGDGTNDAPALHEADIGLAMGIAGTEVAKESADVIILDDNFSTDVTVAKWGCSLYINIQKFIQFQLTVNVVALIVNFSPVIRPSHSCPATLGQHDNGYTLGALALAAEPRKDELMKQSPLGRKDNFIRNVMWRNILGQSTYQFVVIWFLQAKGKALFGLNGADLDLTLNTLIFNSFVFCQVFNEISSREMEKMGVFKGILDNKVFDTPLPRPVVPQHTPRFPRNACFCWHQDDPSLKDNQLWFADLLLPGLISVSLRSATDLSASVGREASNSVPASISTQRTPTPHCSLNVPSFFPRVLNLFDIMCVRSEDSRPVVHRVVDSFLNKFFPSGYPYSYVLYDFGIGLEVLSPLPPQLFLEMAGLGNFPKV
ncbi:hypothetical protein SAY86_005634 [Trapa natans]|uniref:Cation-transporting P-type ATPase C-terminal domain-containing protein n=1 Tax=Trapa natans TaxID=22666 RepID=A0AAN7L991_TRANT|nr:hypothetical protein SAY86_005634 [Trapa natans]